MKKVIYTMVVILIITGCSQQSEDFNKDMKIIHCLTTVSGNSYTQKNIQAAGYKTVEMMTWIARSSDKQVIKNFELDKNHYQLPVEFCQEHECKGPGYLIYKKIRANPEEYNWYLRHLYTVMPTQDGLEKISKHCGLNRQNIQEVVMALIHQVLLGKIFTKEFSESYEYLESGPKLPK